MKHKFPSLLLLAILLSFAAGGCAEFLEDYTYSTGAESEARSASESGTRDPFKDYGTFGPASPAGN